MRVVSVPFQRRVPSASAYARIRPDSSSTTIVSPTTTGATYGLEMPVALHHSLTPLDACSAHSLPEVVSRTIRIPSARVTDPAKMAPPPGPALHFGARLADDPVMS